MKRFLSILVAVVMLLTTVPFAAMAATDEADEHDRLIALACEVFPEYASDIRNENASIDTYSYSNEPDSIVYQYTRPVSDTETLTIAKTARGQVVVVEADDPMRLTYTLAPVNSSSGITGTVSFTITSTQGSGTFKLSNIGFKIFYNSSDYFTSYGTVSIDNGYYTISANRSSATSIRINYDMSFVAPNPAYNLLFKFGVVIMDDQISARVWM